MRALQLPDRGLGREPRRRDHRRRHRATRARAPRRRPGGYAKDVILRVDRADGFVARNLLARGALEHGDLRRGDRRLPARPGEVLLGRRLRQPHLHLRPRALQELRRLRLRRLGRLPGRGAGDRRAGRPLASIPTRRGSTPWSRSATCAARRSPTRARWATRSGSPRTTSTATRTGISTRHDLGRRAPRLPGRQRRDRPQLHLLEQPQPLRRRPAGRAGGRRADRASGSSGRA